MGIQLQRVALNLFDAGQMNSHAFQHGKLTSRLLYWAMSPRTIEAHGNSVAACCTEPVRRGADEFPCLSARQVDTEVVILGHVTQNNRGAWEFSCSVLH